MQIDLDIHKYTVFYITFYNYKKPINITLPIKLKKNSDTKWFANSLL